ncbi:MAG: hypothetical protein J6W98_06420 [Bacteroidales bacterium]|nr:hypothetical protein [Bacteroidales bacterium]
MQRLITLLTACVVLLGTLTSCNLDKDYNFTYINKATIQIKDKDDFDAVVDYMKTNFLEVKDNTTYFGKYKDAMPLFIDHFLEVQKKADEAFIRAHLKEDSDFVRLIGYMCYSDGESWVGYRTWKKDDPEGEAQE